MRIYKTLKDLSVANTALSSIMKTCTRTIQFRTTLVYCIRAGAKGNASKIQNC